MNNKILPLFILDDSRMTQSGKIMYVPNTKKKC